MSNCSVKMWIRSDRIGWIRRNFRIRKTGSKNNFPLQICFCFKSITDTKKLPLRSQHQISSANKQNFKNVLIYLVSSLFCSLNLSLLLLILRRTNLNTFSYSFSSSSIFAATVMEKNTASMILLLNNHFLTYASPFSCSQFHQHLTISFLANRYSPKKYKNTNCKYSKASYVTLSYKKKAACTMLMKMTPPVSFCQCSVNYCFFRQTD